MGIFILNLFINTDYTFTNLKQGCHNLKLYSLTTNLQHKQ